MIENIVLQISDDEYDFSVARIKEDQRKNTSEKLKALDAAHKINISTSIRENSYDNDDYLFVSDLLQGIRDLHRKIYYDPYEKKWIRGHSEIPYIHLEFINRPAVSLDEFGRAVPDDKKLNMGVSSPLPDGSHILKFNYYWLKRYLSFLRSVFDSNEEEVICLPSDATCNGAEYKTKEEVLKTVNDLFQQGLTKQAKVLTVYVNSFWDNEKIEMPFLTFLDIKDQKRIVTWSFYDEKSRSFKIPMKKTIYNTSGFAELFEERNALVSELFFNSLKMLLGHETAHVARGHWLLRVNEQEYSEQRNVMMNCEINADWTAALWLLNETLYDTVDGDPHSNILIYTKKEYVFVLSVRILSIYLALSWTQRDKDDRVWTVETVKNFVKNNKATHPIYQFRLFNVLNHIKMHLAHMADQCEKDGFLLKTVDGESLNKKIFDEVWKRGCDMIFSFEYAFRVCLDDERDALQKINEGLFIKENAMPTENEKVPFFLCYMKKAQDELNGYEEQWQEILEKLRRYGMFFRM